MKPAISKKLAWELADQLRRHLDDTERMAVFVDLGSGEEKAAVHRLIHLAAKHEHPLPSKMFQQLRVWAYAHDAQDDYAPMLARIHSARVDQLAIALRTRLGENY